MLFIFLYRWLSQVQNTDIYICSGWNKCGTSTFINLVFYKVVCRLTLVILSFNKVACENDITLKLGQADWIQRGIDAAMGQLCTGISGMK